MTEDPAYVFPDVGFGQGIPAQAHPNAPVGSDSYFLDTLSEAFLHRAALLTTSLSKLHKAPCIALSLIPGSLPPTKEEQKIFDNSPVVICTTPVHRLAWSAWKRGPLVGLKW